MNLAEQKKEKLLEVIFSILLFVSLICFAGIPALDSEAYQNKNAKITLKTQP